MDLHGESTGVICKQFVLQFSSSRYHCTCDVLCFPYLHDIAFLCAWVCDVYVVSPTGRVGLTVIANVQTGIGRVLFAISIYQPWKQRKSVVLGYTVMLMGRMSCTGPMLILQSWSSYDHMVTILTMYCVCTTHFLWRIVYTAWDPEGMKCPRRSPVKYTCTIHHACSFISSA